MFFPPFYFLLSTSYKGTKFYFYYNKEKIQNEKNGLKTKKDSYSSSFLSFTVLTRIHIRCVSSSPLRKVLQSDAKSTPVLPGEYWSTFRKGLARRAVY